MSTDRAWIYSRVASCEQLTPELLTQQEDRLSAFADSAGYAIVGRSSDCCSGMNYSREGLSKVLTAAEHGEIDTVLVVGIDRLGRDAMRNIGVIARLRENGVALATPEHEISESPFLGMLGYGGA